MQKTATKKILDVKKVWKAVLAEMEVQLSETNYKTWLSRTVAKGLTDKEITIVFQNPHALATTDKLFKPMIKNSLKKITKNDYNLIFKVGNVKEEQEKDKPFGPLFDKKKTSKFTIEKLQRKSGLNVNYKLENYISGSANQLAFAIATSIAREPGSKYNPFFLYSGVGLGKTHLIHAIGNKVVEENPEKKVIYVTGENFTNELIESIRGKNKGGRSTDTFRKKYRQVDVLIIDDIQFIAKKDATQEEFFHTFNELYMNQKQIIIASDRPPEAFKDIEERITSRFKSGMLADIQTPDYELRTAILRSKRDDNNENVPNEVIDFIAEHVATNIREVEGAYLQVLAYVQSKKGRVLNIETAKEVLGNIVNEKRDRPLSLTTILKAVCKYYSTTQIDIKGRRRTKELVLPRQVAMYLMYDLTQTPYTSIGEFLGGRDHTTVMHGFDKIRKEVETSMNLRKDLMNIKQAM